MASIPGVTAHSRETLRANSLTRTQESQVNYPEQKSFFKHFGVIAEFVASGFTAQFMYSRGGYPIATVRERFPEVENVATADCMPFDIRDRWAYALCTTPEYGKEVVEGLLAMKRLIEEQSTFMLITGRRYLLALLNNEPYEFPIGTPQSVIDHLQYNSLRYIFRGDAIRAKNRILSLFGYEPDNNDEFENIVRKRLAFYIDQTEKVSGLISQIITDITSYDPQIRPDQCLFLLRQIEKYTSVFDLCPIDTQQIIVRAYRKFHSPGAYMQAAIDTLCSDKN